MTHEELKQKIDQLELHKDDERELDKDIKDICDAAKAARFDRRFDFIAHVLLRKRTTDDQQQRSLLGYALCLADRAISGKPRGYSPAEWDPDLANVSPHEMRRLLKEWTFSLLMTKAGAKRTEYFSYLDLIDLTSLDLTALEMEEEERRADENDPADSTTRHA